MFDKSFSGNEYLLWVVCCNKKSKYVAFLYFRRSSLLPHLNAMDPKFDEHLLSPVLPAASNVKTKNMNIPYLNLAEREYTYLVCNTI